jgi:hypothetical protein
MRPKRGWWLTVPVVSLIVVLFVMPSGFGGSALAQPSASFAFPYTYGTPVVPSSVGAHSSGPNVPASQIGPLVPESLDGAQGRLGPVNGTGSPGVFAQIGTSLTVQVYNGTARSHVVSGHTTVSLENVTTGNTTTQLTTTAGGNTTFATYEGWYVLRVTPLGSTFDSFVEQVDPMASHETVTVYCLPVSTDTITIGNGPSPTGSLYVTLTPTWNDTGLSEVNVTLLNVSNSGAPLGTATTQSNGTAVFTSISTAWDYGVYVEGWNLSWTNEVYDYLNYTYNGAYPYGPHFTVTTGANHWSLAEQPQNRWTATVTGTALTATGYPGTTGAPTGYYLPSVATVLKGGYVFLGSDVSTSGAAGTSVTFENTIVYVDGDVWEGWTWADLKFENSVIVMLTQAGIFSAPGADQWYYLNNTVYIGSDVWSATFGATASFTHVDTLNCLIENLVKDDKGGALTQGDFTNTELLDWSGPDGVAPGFGSVNLTRVSIVNSDLTDFGTATMWINATDVVTLNSTWSNAGVIDNIVNCYLDYIITGVTETGGLTTYAGAPPVVAKYSHDSIWDSIATGLNFQTVYNALTIISTNRGPGHADFDVVLPTLTNLSDSVILFTAYPDINTSLVQGGSVQSLYAYDDILGANYTPAQVAADLPDFSGTPAPPTPDVTFQTFGHLYVNYTDMDFGAMSYWYTQNGNSTFAHDVWPWLDWTDVRAFNQGFVGAPTPQHDKMLFSNDTFEYTYTNISLSRPISYWQGGYPASLDYVNDYNDANHETTRYLAVNDSTFYARETDAYNSPSGALGLIMDGENQVTSMLDGDVFYNSPQYTLGPSSSFAPPFAVDVGFDAGTGTLEDSWFLNLNNYTVPVSLAGLDGGPQGWGGHLTLVGNHFFYAPTSGETYVPAYGEILPSLAAVGGHVDPNTGIGNTSVITYELPNGRNTTLTFGSGDQLVSNTSISQTDPVGISWRDPWSWSVAPDVNTSSGAPVVSYDNGLEGGPQPNFWWHGYNYSESVEASQVYLAVNSTQAPDVSVVLSGIEPGPATLQVLNATTTDVLSSTGVVVDSNGTYTATFTPSSMSGGVVFSLVSDLGAPGAPNGSGLILLALAILVGGFLTAIIIGAFLENKNRRN